MSRTALLGIATGAFMLLSIFSYISSQSQALRFERGQKFIPNLNPDEIYGAVVSKGGEVTQLKRSGDNFVLVSSHNYPAKNEAVNRFIRDVLKISLEKKVGKGESLEKELNLTTDSEDSIRVVFNDKAGKEMVRFLVGKSLDGGGGSYVMRENGEEKTIYLTSSQVYLSTGDGSFIDKEILNVEQSEVQKIHGTDFTIAEQDGALALANVPSGKKETAGVNQLKSALTSLTFENVYLADDTKVAGLKFEPRLTYDLKNQAHYQLALAQDGEKTYLRVSGSHDLRSIDPAELESDEAVKEKSEQWEAAVKIQEFNQFHGSWVYELNEYTAKKLIPKFSDLIEDEKKTS